MKRTRWCRPCGSSPLHPTACALLCAYLALATGCRQPWYAADDAPSETLAQTDPRPPADAYARAEHAPVATTKPDSEPPTGDPFEALAATAPADSPDDNSPDAEAGRKEAFEAILAELEQAEAIDPETKEQLRADLEAAAPAHWPLIVHQLRATLAYRRQHMVGEAEESGKDSVGATSRPAVQTAAFVQDDSEPPTGQAEEASAPERSTGEAEDLAAAFAGGDASGNPEPDHETNTLAQTGPDHQQATPLPFPEPVLEPDPIDPATHGSASPGVAESIPAPPVGASGVAVASFERPAAESPIDLHAAMQGDPNGPAPASDESAPTAEDLSWQRLLDLAIAGLKEETASPPVTSSEITEHVRLRLLQVAAGNQSEALQPIAGVPPHQQDFWAKELYGLSLYLEDQATPDVRRRASLAQQHLEDALDLLGESAVLDVRNLTFCATVRGYGIYEPLDRPRFHPDEQVKLYAEVHNYKSESTEEGFRTLLATSYEILDASDRRVDSGEFPQVEDLCRSRRRDFHIQYGVSLPTRIYPGEYRLQLTIEDMLSRKLGRASVAFEIVDDGPSRR